MECENFSDSVRVFESKGMSVIRITIDKADKQALR